MTRQNIYLLAAIAALFSGCSSVSRNDLIQSPKNDTEKIIYFGSLAGNSHNTQPWIVEIVNDSTLRLFADFSRKLQIVDPDGRGLFISLGAFLENMQLSANSLGYNSNITITAETNSDSLAAIFKFSRLTQIGAFGNLTKLDNASLIEKRRTLRTPFLKTEISKEHQSTLLESISNYKGKVFYFSAASEKGKYIAEKTHEAYSCQSRDEQAKQELSNWMRFSNKDASKHKDGLTPLGMGITGIGGFIVRNFYKPEDSMKESFVEKGIESAKEQVDNCGGWLVIVQDDDNPENWMSTGRIYQKLNLLSTDLMIGFHPMNQMIEEDKFETPANEFLGLPGKIQFVARIGYVESYPEAVSVRRPVNEIIRNSVK